MANRPQAEVEETRARILDAAEDAFATSGYAGASMSDIALRAGITKSLIHHHFESKQRLWETVRVRRLGAYEALEQISSDEGGQTFVRKSGTDYFRFLQDHPHFVRILYWSQAEDSSKIHPALEGARRAAREVVARRAAQLAELQKRGEIRADLDPQMLVACFIGMMHQWPAQRADYFGAAPDKRRVDDEFLHTAITLFWEGVRPKS